MTPVPAYAPDFVNDLTMRTPPAGSPAQENLFVPGPRFRPLGDFPDIKRAEHVRLYLSASLQ
jgi:hypothetical protein